MSTIREYNVTAIILRSREYGEGNRLFSLLTREFGKIIVVARGVQKPKSKLGPLLQIFALVDIRLTVGKRFDIITGVNMLNAHYALRGDITAFAYASYFAELFDVSLEEKQEHPELFDLMYYILDKLTKEDENPEMLARFVELKLCHELGYAPCLEVCVHCGVPIASVVDGKTVWPDWVSFSGDAGGAVCPGCAEGELWLKSIPVGALQIAMILGEYGPDAMKGKKISKRLRDELNALTKDYIELKLEGKIKSAEFLKMISDEQTDLSGQV
jgi:DNA repair protein RecO (recombination protein O)